MSALAYFVSPHGFGHAARAAAVMEALAGLRPEIELHVFTTVPRWFFDDSLGRPFVYHPVHSDVGLVQSHPFTEDLPATVTALEEFWNGLPAVAAEMARTLERNGVGLVVSDVSPLGLAAAAAAGLPGVLVENFTWDWIYRGYVEEEPRLEEFMVRNRELLARATLRIQAEPVCAPVVDAVTVPPVSREARAGRAETRRAVGLSSDDPRTLVLLTMGGLGWADGGPLADEGVFLVTLGGRDSIERSPSGLALPDRSPVFPPDLAAAADLIVAKLGYSTVAECRAGGTRLLFLERPRFAESDVLASFCRRELNASALDPERLADGSWLADLSAILARPAPAAGRSNGAGEIARLLAERLGSGDQ